jgi:hypothetical protein
MRLAVLLLALLLVAPPIGALPALTLPPPVTLDPAGAYGTALGAAELATATNLTREDVRIHLDLDFRSLDFGAIGVVFGGGDFRAQGRLSAHLEFRAINVSRVYAAVPGFDAPERVNATAGRTVLTAGELRATLSAAAIAAFEAQEQAALTSFVTTTFPDATLLSSRFEWSNVSPRENPTPQPEVPAGPSAVRSPLPDSREPPVALDTVLDVQYLKRESLVGILAELLDQEHLSAAERQKKADRKHLLDEIRGENSGALYERSAFDLLGITQLIVIKMDPGWNLDLTLHLPKGYTYEYASPDVRLDAGHGSASAVTLADASADPVRNPVAVSLSNRFLVAVALLGAVLLCGAVLRFPAMLVAGRVGRRDGGR